MKIHVLASNDIISFCFFYPLLAWRKELAGRGFPVKFFSKIDDRLFAGEVLLLDNRFFTPLWAERSDEAFAWLQKIRAAHKHIIWVDVTDSTGATQFRVLPYVDKYWKKQVLKGRRLYLQTYYGARIYTDYYKKQFSLPEQEAFAVEPIEEKFLSKIAVSWNLGMGPCFYNLKTNNLINHIPFVLKQYLPFRYKTAFYSSDKRPKDICFRGVDQYNNLSLAFQRLEVKKRLAVRGIDTTPIAHGKYFQELCSSQICVSPFGAGEICSRDFEIIQAGGVLFKPDMSHAETWPDVFVDDKTYVSFRWDFSDFEAKTNVLLGRKDRMKEIVRNAQDAYRHCFSLKGREEFCERFERLIF